MLAAALALAALASTPMPGRKSAPKPPPAKAAPAAPPPVCDGDYADALPADLTARILQRMTGDSFVYLIRNTATYEHVYYGRDSKLRRGYIRSVIHGTAFAYKVTKDGETLLVTNQHVAEQPEVTDDDHTVEGVPSGSRKVREVLKIVHSDGDDYEPGHIPVTKLLADAQDDIGLLKTKAQLTVLPYRLGRSSALRAGNAVTARGFPLGEFAAVNTGKVINPHQIDAEGAWNHVDFVVDALLNSGNSGSPVFAVSCRTGEPELVGVYHAGYKDAAALNVVVGIDQLKEVLDTLKVPKHDRSPNDEITALDRDRVVKALFNDSAHALVFPFAGRAVRLALVDPQTLRFSLLDSDFPLTSTETMALTDKSTTGFGTLDAVVVGGASGMTEQEVGALEADVREHFQRLYDSLWRQLVAVLDYRALATRSSASAEAFRDAQAARAALARRSTDNKDLWETCLYDSDRIAAMPLRAAAAGGDGTALAAPKAEKSGGASTDAGTSAQ